jgi:hypothetical protein
MRGSGRYFVEDVVHVGNAPRKCEICVESDIENKEK